MRFIDTATTLDVDFEDLAEPPRMWCFECRKHQLFRSDMDGYPICRECADPEA